MDVFPLTWIEEFDVIRWEMSDFAADSTCAPLSLTNYVCDDIAFLENQVPGNCK